MADITITASSVIPGANAQIRSDLVAAVELTAGLFVHRNTTTDKWEKADADTNTDTDPTNYGWTLNHAYADQRVSVDIHDDDLTPGGTLVTGTTYASSATAGALCPVADLTAGKYVVVGGVAKSTTKLNWSPVASGAVI